MVDLQERIGSSEQARDYLKHHHLEEANTHIIEMEEELYQAKQVQIDMLE